MNMQYILHVFPFSIVISNELCHLILSSHPLREKHPVLIDLSIIPLNGAILQLIIFVEYNREFCTVNENTECR